MNPNNPVLDFSLANGHRRPFSLRTHSWVNLQLHDGYWCVTIRSGDDHRVHRIVCQTFHGAPPAENMVVDHMNQNRSNNHITNLR
jgi:hypothetical protein